MRLNVPGHVGVRIAQGCLSDLERLNVELLCLLVLALAEIDPRQICPRARTQRSVRHTQERLQRAEGLRTGLRGRNLRVVLRGKGALYDTSNDELR